MSVRTPNYHTIKDVAQNAWKQYQIFKSNQAMALEREQGDHLSLLSNMVSNESPYYDGSIVGVFPEGHSRAGEDMSDHEYLAMELANAADMYCMGVDCMDPGQDSAAKMVGMLTRAHGRVYDLYQQDLEWVEKMHGDEGWLSKISKYQSNFGGKHGSEGGKDVLEAMVDYRNAKSKTLNNDYLRTLDSEIKALENYLTQETFMKTHDMPNKGGIYDDSTFNYIDRGDPGYEKHSALFTAYEHMKMGNTEQAAAFHNDWIRNLDARYLDDLEFQAQLSENKKKELADLDKKKRQAWKDSGSEIDGILNSTIALEADNRLGDFSKEFRPKFWMEKFKGIGSDWNETSAKEVKANTAVNLGAWIDEYASGDAKENWKKILRQVQVMHPKVSEDKQLEKAADSFLNLYPTDLQISELVEGRSNWIWMFGEGLDFPGVASQEDAAENYFMAQWKLWKHATDVLNDTDLMTMPEGADTECPPYDPYCLGEDAYKDETKPYEISAIAPSGGSAPGFNTLYFNPADKVKNIAFDENLSTSQQEVLSSLIENAPNDSALHSWINDIDKHTNLDLDSLSITKTTSPGTNDPMFAVTKILDPADQGIVNELSETTSITNDINLGENNEFAAMDAAQIANTLKIIKDFIEKNPDSFPDSLGLNLKQKMRRILNEYMEAPDGLYVNPLTGKKSIDKFVMDNYLPQPE